MIFNTLKIYASKRFFLLALVFSFVLFDSLSLHAQTRNPRPSSYNPYPTYTNGLREFLRMGTGKRNEIIRNTPMYDGVGNQIATAKKGILGDVNGRTKGGYNAAAMVKIRVGGSLKNAVLCWNVATTSNQRRTGFIVTDNLKYKSIVESRMNTCKSRLANVRPNDSGKPTTHYKVLNKTVPGNLADAYIYPNQTGAANKLKYYYVNNGVLNLLVDLPYTRNVQGENKGKAIDLAKPGRSFYRLKSVSSASRDIFKRGTRTVIGKAKFLYGYVLTDNNEKIWCWANMACLGSASGGRVAETEESDSFDAIEAPYPNPVSDGSLRLNITDVNTEVQMFDMNGLAVEINLEIIDGQVTVNSDYVGMTMLKVQTKKGVSFHKVLWK